MNTRKRREKNRRNRARKTARRSEGVRRTVQDLWKLPRTSLQQYLADAYVAYRLGERGWPGT